jgi:hypothetical protein
MRAASRGLYLLSLALLARAAAAQAPMGPEFRVNPSTTGVHGTSVVSVDPAGNFVVVWVAVDGTLSVMGQRFDALGAPRGAEFTVANAGTAAIVSPGVATDANGGFTAVWDERPPGTGDVRGRRYDANGNPAGPAFVVNSATTGTRCTPRSPPIPTAASWSCGPTTSWRAAVSGSLPSASIRTETGWGASWS